MYYPKRPQKTGRNLLVTTVFPGAYWVVCGLLLQFEFAMNKPQNYGDQRSDGPAVRCMESIGLSSKTRRSNAFLVNSVKHSVRNIIIMIIMI